MKLSQPYFTVSSSWKALPKREERHAQDRRIKENEPDLWHKMRGRNTLARAEELARKATALGYQVEVNETCDILF